MSFEVFVQCFKNGEFAGVPRQRIRDAFGTYATEKAPRHWELRYDDLNFCDVRLTPDDFDESLVHGFCVLRPCVDARLWDTLASILAFGDMVLYFPGCRAPLVSDSRVTQHLPASMVEALGQPVCVSSGREIEHEIQAA